jgi:hypothetical protein
MKGELTGECLLREGVANADSTYADSTVDLNLAELANGGWKSCDSLLFDWVNFDSRSGYRKK